MTAPTVLIAEDDRNTAMLMRQVLCDAGYEVVLTINGREAIARLCATPRGFALALLDLVMPGIDGIAVIEAARVLCPDLPVVLTSGYSEAYVRSRVGDTRLSGFLAKPWPPEQLLRTVRDALDAERVGPVT